MAVKDLYDKACEAANKGNYQYAIELFREVLRLEPENTGARVLLRGTERRRFNEMNSPLYVVSCVLKGVVPLLKAHIHIKKPLKRLECCEDFLELNPNSVRGLLKAGEAARAAGLLGAAITIFKDAMSLKPEDKKALLCVGNALEQDGQIKEAVKFLAKLAALSPTDRDLQYRVKNVEAQAHMQESRLEDADSFRDLIRDKDIAKESERRYDSPEERRDRLLQQFQEELATDPDNVTKIVRVAGLLEDKGQGERALNMLKDACKRVPGSYQLRERLGDLRLRLCEQALEGMAGRIEEEPDNEDVKQRRQSLLSKSRELAVREYTWRVKQHPTDNELRIKFGHVLFDAGDVDGAIQSFQQAARDPRHQMVAATMLGRGFMLKGQSEMAVEQFRRALARHPELDHRGLELHYALAESLEQAGHGEQALEEYTKIYTHDIGFRDVAAKVESLSD